MVRLEKTQFPWRVYLNCDTKDILKRQRDLWHHSAVLLTVATDLLLVWTPEPKGSLKEESEFEALLELGEGFGIRTAAVDMKFGAAWWFKLLSHEAFWSMDTVELDSQSGECFADISFITLNFTHVSRSGRSTILLTEGAGEIQSQKEAYMWACGLSCCKWGVSFYWISIIIRTYSYFFTSQEGRPTSLIWPVLSVRLPLLLTHPISEKSSLVLMSSDGNDLVPHPWMRPAGCLYKHHGQNLTGTVVPADTTGRDVPVPNFSQDHFPFTNIVVT